MVFTLIVPVLITGLTLIDALDQFIVKFSIPSGRKSKLVGTPTVWVPFVPAGKASDPAVVV